MGGEEETTEPNDQRKPSLQSRLQTGQFCVAELYN